MPQIAKQSKTGQRAMQSNGSVLAGAVPVGKVEDDWIRMSLYGGNRVGKTTLACRFPKPLLLVAFEPNKTGGSRSVRSMPGVFFLRLTSSEEGLGLCKELQATGGQVPVHLGGRGERFATYVIDGATSYQDVVLQEVMGWDVMPEQLSFGMVGKERYQERAEKVKVGLRPFLSLPGHVLVLAKEKDHNPPKDDYSSLHKLTGGLQMESFYAEDVGGSVSGWLHDECDFIGRMYVAKEVRQVERVVKIAGKTSKKVEEVETGKLVRRILCQYHPNFAAGFRSEAADVPMYVEGRTPDELYAALVKVMAGEPIG